MGRQEHGRYEDRRPFPPGGVGGEQHEAAGSPLNDELLTLLTPEEMHALPAEGQSELLAVTDEMVDAEVRLERENADDQTLEVWRRLYKRVQQSRAPTAVRGRCMRRYGFIDRLLGIDQSGLYASYSVRYSLLILLLRWVSKNLSRSSSRWHARSISQSEAE